MNRNYYFYVVLTFPCARISGIRFVYIKSKKNIINIRILNIIIFYATFSKISIG